jgi:hypothetical protein
MVEGMAEKLRKAKGTTLVDKTRRDKTENMVKGNQF